MTSYFSGFYPSETADGAKGSAAFIDATNTDILQLYKRSAVALLDTDKPNGSVTYTFATGIIDLSNVTNGWTTTIPSGTDPVYVVAATAASLEPTDTIATNEWSSPIIFVQNGTSTATVFLYKRGNTNTLPAVPTQPATYTFASGILLGTSSAGNTVSPFLNGWTQTAPDSAGNKYLFMITATAISTGATDTIAASEYSEVRIMAQDGAVGYTAYLTNESHTLTASSTGAVSSYVGASGEFKVFLDGTGDISSAFTLSTLAGSNPQTLTIAYSYPAGVPTYTVSGGFDAGEDVATVTIRATGSGIYSGIILDKVFSLSKSKTGINGEDAKLLSVSTSRQLISYSGAGALSPPTQTTTLTATKQNTTATVNWTIQDSLGNTLTPATYLSATTGDSITMTAANFQAAISVNASEGVTIIGTLTDGITLSDRVTIMKVRAGADGTDGDDGLNGINSASVFLYQRATSAPAVPAVDSTYTFSTKVLTGTLGSWSQTIPLGTNPIYVISATAASSSATDIIPTSEWAVPSILAQNGVNGNNGINTATVFLYQRATSAPAVPAADSTYTFSTGVLTGTLGSWTQTVPAGTNPIYVISATASSNTSTDTIPTSEWASPSILAQNGAAGSNGLNNAIVYLYQRATSSPTAPTGTFTYTFSTGALSGGTPGSWTQTIPSGVNPLYVIAATASSNTATDSILATEFSSPVIFVQNGAAGSNGLNNAIVYLYQRAASAPAAPTGTFTYTFSSRLLTGGTLGSWTQIIPSGTDPLYVIAATASSSTDTDSIPATEFSTAVILVQNGTAGTAASSASLTRESQSLFAYANGNVVSFASANGFMKIFSGNTDVTATATSFSATASGCTGTINTADNTPVNGQVKGYYQITAMSADTATLTLSATYSGTTFTKVYTITKTRGGYEIVATLPIADNFIGRVVFLTTDGRLYRNTTGAAGTSGWTTAVPSTDISGTLTSAQIDSLAASQITGQLSDTQLAAIAAAKITGTITGTQITDGAITTAKISAGAITSNQIAANTIVAADIAAGAITATEISAGAVTTAKLAAGAVTASTIAADTITAAQIAANAITASEIATNAITTDKVSAGAITAAKIGVTQLDAISATIGTLRTATTGARTEISDNVIKVFDTGSTIRVKIGNLAL